jgi:hypothetical protein
MILEQRNISAQTITTLTSPGVGGGDFKLRISNNHTSDCLVSVWLYDGTTDFYFIKNLVMPTATAVTLDTRHSVGELTEGFGLKVQTHSATTNITLMKYND